MYFYEEKTSLKRQVSGENAFPSNFQQFSEKIAFAVINKYFPFFQNDFLDQRQSLIVPFEKKMTYKKLKHNLTY